MVKASGPVLDLADRRLNAQVSVSIFFVPQSALMFVSQHRTRGKDHMRSKEDVEKAVGGFSLSDHHLLFSPVYCMVLPTYSQISSSQASTTRSFFFYFCPILAADPFVHSKGPTYSFLVLEMVHLTRYVVFDVSPHVLSSFVLSDHTSKKRGELRYN